MRLFCPWDCPGKNTEVIAIASYRVCSRPRNQTQIPISSALAGRFFTTSATWEAKLLAYILLHDLIVEFNHFTWMQRVFKNFLFKHLISYVCNYVLWKWSESFSCLVVSDSFRLHGLSPPGSSVYGILQVRRLDWVSISFSRRSSQPRDRTCVSSIAGRFFTI